MGERALWVATRRGKLGGRGGKKESLKKKKKRYRKGTRGNGLTELHWEGGDLGCQPPQKTPDNNSLKGQGEDE